MSEARVSAIIGPQQCGKTTLAREIARAQWLRHRRRSLVFDPWRSNWGPWAWVTDSLEQFMRAAYQVHGFAVFWEEASDSLERNDKRHRGFFTRLREREVNGRKVGHPALYVLAHDFPALAPIMRNNLNELWLFRQGAKRAQEWADLFTDDALAQSAQLGQFQFMHKRPFRPAVTHRPPNPAALARVVCT